MPRAKADFLEGRLRGRAINAHDRVEAETLALHGNPFPVVKELREAPTPLEGLRDPPPACFATRTARSIRRRARTRGATFARTKP